MKDIPASDARRRFGRLLEAAQAAPVRVTKQERPVAVLMSMAQYARLRGAAWERVSAAMEAAGAEAAASGLTDKELGALLSDES
jgi:prevent-host-death family protein